MLTRVILHERIFNLENVYAQGTLVYWLFNDEKPQEGAGAPLLAIAAEWRDLVKQCVCAEANSVCETLERLQRLPVVQSTRPGLETRAATHPRPPSAPHTRPASAPHPPIKRGTRAFSPTGEMRQEISRVSSSCYACACPTPTRRWQPAARRDPRVVEQLGPGGPVVPSPALTMLGGPSRFTNEFELISELGSGAYGSVFKVMQLLIHTSKK